MSKTVVYYKSGAKRNFNIVGELNNRFSKNKRIAKIELGDSVTSIGEDAFYKCSSLTSVTIPGNVITVMYSAFERCSDLKTVTIENGVKNIQYEAFSGCSSLTKIIIPESIKKTPKNFMRFALSWNIVMPIKKVPIIPIPVQIA